MLVSANKFRFCILFVAKNSCFSEFLASSSLSFSRFIGLSIFLPIYKTIHPTSAFILDQLILNHLGMVWILHILQAISGSHHRTKSNRKGGAWNESWMNSLEEFLGLIRKVWYFFWTIQLKRKCECSSFCWMYCTRIVYVFNPFSLVQIVVSICWALSFVFNLVFYDWKETCLKYVVVPKLSLYLEWTKVIWPRYKLHDALHDKSYWTKLKYYESCNKPRNRYWTLIVRTL